MNGMIKDAWVERDGKRARLVILTKNGEKVMSAWSDPRVIAKSYFIVRKYIEWGPLITNDR